MIRKSVLTALVAVLSLFWAGTAGTAIAFAEEASEGSGISITSDSDSETEDSTDDGEDDSDDDAEDDSDESSDSEDSEIDKKHKELDEKYGKEPSLSVPPLVIRPYRDSDDKKGYDDGDDGISGGKVGGQNSSSLSGLSSANLSRAGLNFIAISPRDYRYESGSGIAPGTPVNPEGSSPITIQQISFDQQTPAEVFLQASQIGLYVMGFGALALGVFAGASIIRRK